MPLPSTYSGKALSNDLTLSDGESELWENAQSTTDHAIILLSKRLEKSSESSEKHAKSLTFATWVLAVATIVLAIATLLLLFKSGA
jgi:hypothetical protein